MQSLRGIRDIHESGVDERSFSEVTRYFADCTDVLHRLLACRMEGLNWLSTAPFKPRVKTIDHSTADNVFLDAVNQGSWYYSFSLISFSGTLLHLHRHDQASYTTSLFFWKHHAKPATFCYRTRQQGQTAAMGTTCPLSPSCRET